MLAGRLGMIRPSPRRNDARTASPSLFGLPVGASLAPASRQPRSSVPAPRRISSSGRRQSTEAPDQAWNGKRSRPVGPCSFQRYDSCTCSEPNASGVCDQMAPARTPPSSAGTSLFLFLAPSRPTRRDQPGEGDSPPPRACPHEMSYASPKFTADSPAQVMVTAGLEVDSDA